MPFQFLLPIVKFFGKAPAVQVFGIQELNNNLLDAGFVEIIGKKVSSDKTNGFFIAAKPG